ncbi:MAG TPA: hypothetical protein VKT29_12010 [Terriglobales bacterium]|nr:hypothetical protein [Terriglobales bacterium]
MASPNTQHPSLPSMDEARVKRGWRRKLLLVVAGFAIAAFLVIEITHYLLVPELGPYRERVIAEAGSALILAMLAARLLQNAYKARQQALARLQLIAEVNHHVRNALEVISLSAYITRDEEAIRRIMEGVNRIDWVLREILPREQFPPGSAQPPLASGAESSSRDTAAGPESHLQSERLAGGDQLVSGSECGAANGGLL